MIAAHCKWQIVKRVIGGNQLIAQVEILMQMLSKVPIKISNYLSTIDNEDQNYDQMLMQHPLFNRYLNGI